MRLFFFLVTHIDGNPSNAEFPASMEVDYVRV